MNKVAIQIGLLALCISFIVFVLQKLPLIEAVSKSFIVFFGVTIAAGLLLYVTVAMTKPEEAHETEHQDSHADSKHTHHHSNAQHTASRVEA